MAVREISLDDEVELDEGTEPENEMDLDDPEAPRLTERWAHQFSFSWLPKEFWRALGVEGYSGATLTEREAQVNALIVRFSPVPFHSALSYALTPRSWEEENG